MDSLAGGLQSPTTYPAGTFAIAKKHSALRLFLDEAHLLYLILSFPGSLCQPDHPTQSPPNTYVDPKSK